MKLKLVYVILTLLLIASCKQVQKVSDVITNPSSKEILERGFKTNYSLFKSYNRLYLNAKLNKLQLDLPSVLTSFSDSLDFQILAYTVDLKQGERFRVESDIKPDSLQLAIDLYAFENDSMIAKKPLVSNNPELNAIQFDVSNSGKFKVVIMPKRQSKTNYGLKIFTEPTFVFPVSGKGNSAIQSFWGATRGGGTRSHKGIDIFAKRGTPVVAATDGFISNTGNRGLGGKQVWLRDGLFGQSLYYAHLDSIAVSGGNRVKVGDTLGFVGNTGNAKTTSPHLHFGIYTRNGAVDPLPFVKRTTQVDIKVTKLFSKGKTRLRTNELRIGAGVKNEKIKSLDSDIPLQILSKNDSWFHIKLNDKLQGFMHESLISKT